MEKRGMGQPRHFSSPEEMEELWEEFKEVCDNKTVVRTEFSQKESRFVTDIVPAPVSYTILGFCVFTGISRTQYYETYTNDPSYAYITARIESECEKDVREKFENKTFPSQLSALWMSKYGYSVKNDQNITGSIPVVISGEDDLKE